MKNKTSENPLLKTHTHPKHKRNIVRKRKLRKIGHVINPVVVPQTSDLYVAQPVTFESMRVAKKYAKGIVDVELYSAQFPEDYPLVPKFFNHTPNLTRSALDLGTFRKKRKLPMLGDIIDRLYNSTDADYLIYTNVDIALMPYFYVVVNKLIDDGHDSFSITRRTITNKYNRIAELPFMYAETGENHPGHDCIVFRREVFPEFEFQNMTIGSGHIGKAMVINLMAFSKNFLTLRNSHLTFHIGNDQVWQHYTLHDQLAFNSCEFGKILIALEKKIGTLEKNPSISTFLNLKENPPLEITNDYKYYLKLSQRLNERLDFMGAIKASNNAIKLASNPNQTVPASIIRAKARVFANDLKGASKDASKAIELIPENANAYFIRGRVRRLQGKLKKAIKDFSKAISLQPQNSRYYSQRAKTYEWLGQLELALEDFNMAISLTQDDKALSLLNNERHRIYLLQRNENPDKDNSSSIKNNNKQQSDKDSSVNFLKNDEW